MHQVKIIYSLTILVIKMKYSIIWHDAEDDRTGKSFEVEGADPKEAFYKAKEYIKGISESGGSHILNNCTNL